MFGLIRKPYKVYILYKDCTQFKNSFSGVLGVYNTYSEALRHFADEKKENISFWEDETIEYNSENYFCAYEEGNYCPNHCILAIVEKNVEEIYNNKKTKKN